MAQSEPRRHHRRLATSIFGWGRDVMLTNGEVGRPDVIEPTLNGRVGADRITGTAGTVRLGWASGDDGGETWGLIFDGRYQAKASPGSLRNCGRR